MPREHGLEWMARSSETRDTKLGRYSCPLALGSTYSSPDAMDTDNLTGRRDSGTQVSISHCVLLLLLNVSLTNTTTSYYVCAIHTDWNPLLYVHTYYRVGLAAQGTEIRTSPHNTTCRPCSAIPSLWILAHTRDTRRRWQGSPSEGEPCYRKIHRSHRSRA